MTQRDESNTVAMRARPGEEIGAVYSNFDHQLDHELAHRLAEGGCHAQHAAWDFCGYVWRLEDGRWIEQVWRYNSPVQEIVGDELEEIIELANDEWGYE